MATLEDKRSVLYFLENKSIESLGCWDTLKNDPQLAFVTKRLRKIAKHKAKMIQELSDLIDHHETALENALAANVIELDSHLDAAETLDKIIGN